MQITHTAVKETALNIRLHGVLISSENANSHAIITRDKKQSLYRVGEELSSGVTLVNVLADRAIINNNGSAR